MINRFIRMPSLLTVLLAGRWRRNAVLLFSSACSRSPSTSVQPVSGSHVWPLDPLSFETRLVYSPGYQSLNMTFGVDSTQATLGLTLFVLGYGIGPLFLSATSEIPQLGRNPSYIITLALFVIIQIPSALATSFRTLLALRSVSILYVEHI